MTTLKALHCSLSALAFCLLAPLAHAGPANQTPSATTVTAPNLLIPDSGPGSRYPSTNAVSGLVGTITKVTVTLTNLTHAYASDLDILLVGPGGQTVLLMSDKGGGDALLNATLTFDDAAVSVLPDGGGLPSGTYRPGNSDFVDAFPAPAPAGPYGSTLAVFNGTAPGGDWKLFVVDDEAPDGGTLGGWHLQIATTAGTGTFAEGQGAAVIPTVTEDAALVFSTATARVVAVSDPAIGTSPLQLTLSSAHGTLTLASLAGLTGSGNGTATLTYTGTLASLNAALDGFSFLPAPDFNGAAMIVMTSSDLGASGGAPLTDTDLIPVTVTVVNDAPTLAAIADPAALLENAGAQTVNLTGINAGGGESQGLTVTATSSNPALIPNPTVTYTSPAATGSLAYTPVANASGTAVITVTVTDDGGTANGGVNVTTRTFTVTVTAAHAGPVNQTPSGTVVTAPNLLIPASGPGSRYPSTNAVSGLAGTITKLTVTLTNLTHAYASDLDILLVGPGGQTVLLMSDKGGGDALLNATLTFDDAAVSALPDGGGIPSGTYRPGNSDTVDVFPAPAPAGPYGTTLAVFNGTAPGGDWKLFLIDDEAPDGGTLGGWRIQIETTAGAGTFVEGQGATVPATVAEDAALVFSTATARVMAVSDPAIGTSPLQLTLSSAHGTLTLSSLAGLTGSGNGTATLTYTGTLASLNAALDGLSFRPATDFNGAATITMTSSDLGASGGAPLTDTDLIPVTVTAVNDAPSFTLSAGTGAGGALNTWGQNGFGQLGDGSGPIRNRPGQIGTATDWQSVAAGAFHTVAVKRDGTLWAWGYNSNGQLGDGTTVSSSSPGQIGTATDWQVVAADGYHTVAVKRDGTLWAWGYNFFGQLGDGTTVDKPSPVQIGTATDWQSVAAGGGHTVAVKRGGTLWAWGFNNLGQLGDGTSMFRTSPVPIGTATDWQSVAAGNGHTAAVKRDGTLWAWGYNLAGQLGDGTRVVIFSPVQIGTATDWQSVAAGDNHTVAVKSGGTLWAWGDNGEGQLGDGTTTLLRTSPVQVGTATDWQSVAAGSEHTVAVKRGGTLWAWGFNEQGQLGDRTTVDKNSPVQIGTATNWQSVAAGSYHTVALAGSGTGGPSTLTVPEDAGAQTVAGFVTGVLVGPADEAGQSLTNFTVSSSAPGMFAVAPAVALDGTLTFTLAANANGSVTLTVIAQDNGGTADGGVDRGTNTFTLVVTAVNDAPVAVNDSYIVSQGDVLTVAAAGVLANDTDVENNALTATRLTGATQGPVVLNANGSFTYTPNTNFYGTDSFTYRANDGTDNSAAATVSILVYARPTNAVPAAQTMFANATLRFSATHTPLPNVIRTGDPDSSELTVSLTVTNGTVAVSNLAGLTFLGGQTNGTNVVFTGPAALVNAALESLAYTPKLDYFGDETLVIVVTDEGGRTNRGNSTVPILIEIPTLGGVPKVSLDALNNPTTGLRITNVTAVALNTNLVQGITFDSASNVVNVLPVGGQDGSTNRSTITVSVRFNDGTTRLVTVPVIIYQPLLAATTNAGGVYDSTFGTPLFNLQTSLYEQKVRVQNNTPFDFTALRITATNLPATVMLQNATITNGGVPYIDYNVPVLAGSNVTLKLEYFSSDLAPFTPGLKLELLNTIRTNAAPAGAVMTAVAPRTGYSPDGTLKNYLHFPSRAGQNYYVQYYDTVTLPQVWQTSGVVIPGTGLLIHWMDDGPPSTDTPPGPLRFYRVVTDR